MNRVLGVSLLFLGMRCVAPAGADPLSETGLFPGAHDLFHPLRADPRELQYNVSAALPVSHKLLGEAAMGDYLGLYRWALPWDHAFFQVSVGGGVFGRFDLAGTNNDAQVIDFYGNLPFDIRIDKWSARFMPYHTSSHLGDDLLKKTGQTTNKHSWDNLRWLLSYDANHYLRLYGGYTYVFRTLPSGIGRHALQAGIETTSGWWGQGHAQTYWANDFQSWERQAWNPMFDSQMGIKWVREAHAARSISTYVEFSAGALPQGQFYLQHETRWTLGLKFDLT